MKDTTKSQQEEEEDADKKYLSKQIITNYSIEDLKINQHNSVARNVFFLIEKKKNPVVFLCHF